MALMEYRKKLAQELHRRQHIDLSLGDFDNSNFKETSKQIANNCLSYLNEEIERVTLVSEIQGLVSKYLYNSSSFDSQHPWQAVINGLINEKSRKGENRYQTVLAILSTSTWDMGYYFKKSEFVSVANLFGATLVQLRALTNKPLPVFWDAFRRYSMENKWSSAKASVPLFDEKERFSLVLASLISIHLPFMSVRELASYFVERADRLSFHQAFANHAFGLARVYKSLGMNDLAGSMAGLIGRYEQSLSSLLQEEFGPDMRNIDGLFEDSFAAGFNRLFEHMAIGLPMAGSSEAIAGMEGTNIFMADMFGEYGVNQSVGMFGLAEIGLIDMSPPTTLASLHQAPYSAGDSTYPAAIGGVITGAQMVDTGVTFAIGGVASGNPAVVVGGVAWAGLGVWIVKKSAEAARPEFREDVENIGNTIVENLGEFLPSDDPNVEPQPVETPPADDTEIPTTEPSTPTVTEPVDDTDDKEDEWELDHSSFPNTAVGCVSPWVEEETRWMTPEELYIIMDRLEDHYWSDKTPLHPSMQDDEATPMSSQVNAMFELWLEFRMDPRLINYLPEEESTFVPPELLELMRISATFNGVDPRLINYVPGSVPVKAPTIPKTPPPDNGDNGDPETPEDDDDPENPPVPEEGGPSGSPPEEPWNPFNPKEPKKGQTLSITTALSDILDANKEREEFSLGALRALAKNTRFKSSTEAITIRNP